MFDCGSRHTNTRRKKCTDYKENDVWKKTTLPSLEKQDWITVKLETEKNKRTISTYLNEQHHGIKRTNLCRSEITLWKNWCSLKNANKHSKAVWESRLETQMRKLQQQVEILRQKKNAIGRDENRKATWLEQMIQLKEINQKVEAKEGRLKRYQERIKQYRQNRTFQNNERNFYQQPGMKARRHSHNRIRQT